VKQFGARWRFTIKRGQRVVGEKKRFVRGGGKTMGQLRMWVGTHSINWGEKK